MERTEAVLLLGRSLLDYLPQARQSSQVLGTTAGLAPGRTVPCSACAAKGRVGARGVPCASCQSLVGPKAPADNTRANHGCTPCLVCAGLGWRKRRKGEQAWDDNARVELASGEVGEGTEGDDLERRLAQTTRLLESWEKPDTVAYGWETKKEAMWKAGDYAELEKALETLHHRDVDAWRMWWRVVVVGENLSLTPGAEALLGEATEALAGMMPRRPIRVPRWLRPEERNEGRKTSLWRGRTNGHNMQRAERDKAIVEQRELGWNNTKIATFHALTERRVKQIIRAAVASAPA